MCPRLPAVFDLPAAIVPGPCGRIPGVLGAAVLLILFAATALALRDVINRALRTPDGKGSDAAGGRAKLVRPIMRTFLVVACAASFWSGDASRALLTGLGLAASAMLATLLADDEPGARLVGSLSGVIVFAGVSLLGPRLPAWAAAAGAYPVLAAIPWRGPRSGYGTSSPRDAESAVGAPPAEASVIVVVRAAGRRGAGAPPAEASVIVVVRAAGRRGAGAPPAEASLIVVVQAAACAALGPRRPRRLIMSRHGQ